MGLRDLVAGPWLLGHRLWQRAVPAKTQGGAFRILLFHHVPESKFGRFDAMIARLSAQHGLLTPLEAAGRLDGALTPPPAAPKAGRLPCLLSFDDGFASNLDLARGVLDRHGVKALFFVCPGLIDLAPGERPAAIARTIFGGSLAPEDLAAGQRLMGWDELAELRDAGHGIGAHTLMHRRLAGLAENDLEQEITDSGRRIEQRLGAAPDWFAYPFGNIDAIDARALAIVSRHYRFCRSGVRGANFPGGDPLALCADHLDLERPPAWLHLAIEGGLDGRYADARARLNAMARAARHNSAP